MRWLPLLLLGPILACATPPPVDYGGPSGSWRPAAPPSSVERPSLGEGRQAPPATAYEAPPHGRLLATSDGPAALLQLDLAFPDSLWLAALDPELRARASGGGFVVDGAHDRGERLYLLGRPERLSGELALLLLLEREGASFRVKKAARFSPTVHEGRSCHAEWKLAGVLHVGDEELPVVWEERGVGCGRLVGGGFDRRLLVVGEERVLTVPVAEARLGTGGASDVRDAVAFAVDADGDGREEIWTRGVFSGVRPCATNADPAFWIEELSPRLHRLDGRVEVWRQGGWRPIAGGVLPPDLLRSHEADCTGR